VGTMDRRLNAERVRFFEELQKKAPILVKGGGFLDVFPYSRIVVNQTVKGDLNFRVFEAMMSGAMLLTEDTANGLKDLFVPDQHLVTYAKNDVDAAAAKIAYWLERPEECRAIGRAGREEILRAHCSIHRAERMASLLKGRTRSPGRSVFFSMVPMYTWLAHTLERRSYAQYFVAIDMALERIQEAIRREELLSDELSWHAVRACIEHERMHHDGRGWHQVGALREAYPLLQIPTLLSAWLALNRGQKDRAAGILHDMGIADHEDMFKKIRFMVDGMAVKDPVITPEP
jgi:hypothetical protein